MMPPEPRPIKTVIMEYLSFVYKSMIVLILATGVATIGVLLYNVPESRSIIAVITFSIMISNLLPTFMLDRYSFFYRYYLILDDSVYTTEKIESMLMDGGLNKFKIYRKYNLDAIYIYFRNAEDQMGAKCILSECLHKKYESGGQL